MKLDTPVLVIGGAGYVGSHVCKALATSGYRPIVYDNLDRGHRELVHWGPLEIGDIQDTDRLLAVIRTHRPEAILHFAALTFVGESVQQPLRYYQNNLGGTIRLLEAMVQGEVNRLVFSSTAGVYGDPDAIPIAESHPTRPASPYGHSKRMVEQVLLDQAATHGLRVAILRYFNAAGADPDGEIGEWHDPEYHAIPLAIQAVLTPDQPFRVFGADYPTPDGSAIRDYIHVSDLATAHVAALGRLEAARDPLILNLGTGRGTSVLELLAAIQEVSGHAVPRLLAPRRSGDVPGLVADSRLASQILDWRPKFTDITAMAATAWHWQRNRPKG